MKWLFILIFLLNIAYFSYSSFYHTQNITIIPAVDAQHNSQNQIKLLSEVNADELQLITKTDDILSSVVEPKTAPENDQLNYINRSNEKIYNQCFKIGPVNKKIIDEVRFMLEALYANTVSFQIQTTSAATYHRIYIPPQINEKETNNTLSVLDANGLNDHYVMSIDGRKNAIALGVYKNRRTAENIALKAKNLGFSTTIEGITNDKNSLYYLQIDITNSPDLTAYNELMEQKELKSLNCSK